MKAEDVKQIFREQKAQVCNMYLDFYTLPRREVEEAYEEMIEQCLKHVKHICNVYRTRERLEAFLEHALERKLEGAVCRLTTDGMGVFYDTPLGTLKDLARQARRTSA